MKRKRIKLPNGEELFYRSSGNRSQVLVLIHGNICSGQHLETFIPYLDKYYTVLVPDMRGFGNSSYLQKITSISDFSKDLEFFVRSLGLDTFSLLGWSAGGCICMDYAINHPKQVKSLILIETVGYQGCPIMNENGLPYPSIEQLKLEPTQVNPALQMVLNQDLLSMKKLWDDVMYVHAHPKKEEETKLLEASLKQKNLVEMYWALCHFNLSSECNGYRVGKDIPDGFSVPVMLTWGKEDKIVTLKEIQDTAKAFRAKSLLLLEHCGHNPFLDCPRVLSEHIVQFQQSIGIPCTEKETSSS